MTQQSRTAFLRERTRAPFRATSPPQETPLEVVVPYTSPALTARALSEALKLAHGCDAAVTLMAVHTLPYPTELECPEGIRKRREAELAAVVRTSKTAGGKTVKSGWRGSWPRMDAPS